MASILLIDPDKNRRETVRHVLEDLLKNTAGAWLFVTSEKNEALQKARIHADDISLVVCALVLEDRPGATNGIELLEEIQRITLVKTVLFEERFYDPERKEAEMSPAVTRHCLSNPLSILINTVKEVYLHK